MENIIRKVYKNIVKVQYDTRLNSVSNGRLNDKNKCKNKTYKKQISR